MSVLWSKKSRGLIYEVRAAGKSRRLYTDGVLHSAYNPKRLVTGSTWDLLMLPAFFYPKHSIQNVLVLGVGGGTVIHLLNQFVQPTQITGVELNQIHLSIAKRFFDLKYANLKLVHDDAIAWLKHYQGPGFDMIIDDLFIEDSGEPVTASQPDRSWFALMTKHLTKNGLIVKNHIDRKALKQVPASTQHFIRKSFKSAYSFTHPQNENLVAAYSKQSCSSDRLRSRLAETPGLNPRLKTSRLRYNLRSIRLDV